MAVDTAKVEWVQRVLGVTLRSIPSPPADGAAAFIARLAAMRSRIAGAIQSDRPDVVDIKLKVSEAAVFARKRDFGTANRMLDEVERALSDAAGKSAADGATSAEARYLALFGQLEGDYLSAVKVDANQSQKVADQIAAVKLAWSSASEVAEAGKYADAAAILQKLADGDLLRNLLQARNSAGAKPKPTKLVAQRKFMLTRWARIPGELSAELQHLQQALEKDGIDDNPGELTAAIDDRLQALMNKLRNQMNSGINSGDMSVFKGLRQRVAEDSVLGLLIKSPLVNGSKFKQVMLDAMDEIEKALAA